MSQGVFVKDLEFILVGLRDQTLTAVYAAFYERDEVQSELPLHIRLVFSNGTALRVGCSSDGESLAVDKDELLSFSMQEDGDVKVYDISNTHSIQKCIGNKIKGSRFATIEGGVVIGLEIKFTSGSSVCLLNRGDDLVFSDHFPKYLVDEAVNVVPLIL
jgi:hypothetical protein